MATGGAEVAGEIRIDGVTYTRRELRQKLRDLQAYRRSIEEFVRDTAEWNVAETYSEPLDRRGADKARETSRLFSCHVNRLQRPIYVVGPFHEEHLQPDLEVDHPFVDPVPAVPAWSVTIDGRIYDEEEIRGFIDFAKGRGWDPWGPSPDREGVDPTHDSDPQPDTDTDTDTDEDLYKDPGLDKSLRKILVDWALGTAKVPKAALRTAELEVDEAFTLPEAEMPADDPAFGKDQLSPTGPEVPDDPLPTERERSPLPTVESMREDMGRILGQHSQHRSATIKLDLVEDEPGKVQAAMAILAVFRHFDLDRQDAGRAIAAVSSLYGWRFE